MTIASFIAIAGDVLKMKFLDGYRTYIAAAGLVGLAVSQFAAGNYDAAITSTFAAMGLVGIRAKLEDTPVKEDGQ